MIERWRAVRRVRGTIFILANCSAIAVVFLAVLPIQNFLSDRDAQIAEQSALVARLKAVAAQAPAVEQLAGQLTSEKGHPEFLTGANDGVVAANFQTELKNKVQAAGAQLRSVRSLPVKVSNGLKLV